MSLNAGMVSTRDHCIWLKSKLESSDCSLFLGAEGDNKIGVCRFDIDECGECAEVSVTMNPDFRGKGKAKYLLATALDEFQKNKQRAIYARIKVHNLPSLKAFERVGFKHCLKNQEFVLLLFSPPHLVPKFEKVRKYSDHVGILYRLQPSGNTQ